MNVAEFRSLHDAKSMWWMSLYKRVVKAKIRIFGKRKKKFVTYQAKPKG